MQLVEPSLTVTEPVGVPTEPERLTWYVTDPGIGLVGGVMVMVGVWSVKTMVTDDPAAADCETLLAPEAM